MLICIFQRLCFIIYKVWFPIAHYKLKHKHLIFKKHITWMNFTVYILNDIYWVHQIKSRRQRYNEKLLYVKCCNSKMIKFLQTKLNPTEYLLGSTLISCTEFTLNFRFLSTIPSFLPSLLFFPSLLSSFPISFLITFPIFPLLPPPPFPLSPLL